MLLKAGAEINAKDERFGATALHFAAVNTENPEVISVLLKAGADPNVRDSEGNTALTHALENEALQGTDPLKALEAATNQ